MLDELLKTCYNVVTVKKKGAVEMSKSVYSLVLMDDVVEQIDRMAYAMNTSRSNLINQILAEKVAYVTPEKRMNSIFKSIEQLMDDDSFQVQEQASDAMMSIRSALKYKYKPTIRYSLELHRNPQKTIGQLKVSFRTSSEQLKSDLTSFLKLWATLENTYIIGYFPEGITYRIENGRFIRTFRLPPEHEQSSTEEIGRAIGEYIRMFDDILKVYFANLDNEQEAAIKAKQAYEQYLHKGIVLI